jgi:hypothetical protein
VSPTDKSDGKHFLLPRLGKTPSGTLALGYYTGDSAGALGRFRVAFSSGGDAWAARATLKNPLVLQPSRTGFDSVGDYVGMHALGDGASGVLVSFADNASVAGTSQSHIRMARVVAP